MLLTYSYGTKTHNTPMKKSIFVLFLSCLVFCFFACQQEPDDELTLTEKHILGRWLGMEEYNSETGTWVDISRYGDSYSFFDFAEDKTAAIKVSDLQISGEYYVEGNTIFIVFNVTEGLQVQRVKLPIEVYTWKFNKAEFRLDGEEGFKVRVKRT